MIQTAFLFLVVTSSPTTVTPFYSAIEACAFQRSRIGSEIFAQYTPSFSLGDIAGSIPYMPSKCVDVEVETTQVIPK